MEQHPNNDAGMGRRRFLQLSALAVGGAGGLANADTSSSAQRADSSPERKPTCPTRPFNGPYSGDHLDHIAFPLGGIGAGMICLEGTGALSHFSIRNRPEVYNQPLVFAAVAVKGKRTIARVL